MLWIIFSRWIIGYKNLLRAIENLGIAVVYGIRYYGQGNITEDNYVQFIKHDTISSEYLNQSRNFVTYVREELRYSELMVSCLMN